MVRPASETTPGWRVHKDVGRDGTVHVWPENDLVMHSHESGLECVCGPALERIRVKSRHRRRTYFQVVHHSLDGRERHE